MLPAPVGTRIARALAILTLVLIASVVIGLAVGSQRIDPATLFSDSFSRTLFFRLRLPRVLLGLVIGASHQLPELARAYYERAQEQTLQALADLFAQLTARGLLRIDDPMLAASQFAFLVLGHALDKSLFWPQNPFSDADLKAQADAGVSAFLTIYATQAAPRYSSPSAICR